MGMSPGQIEAAADLLNAAHSDRRPVSQLTQRYPDMDVADAYAVQQRNLTRRLADGRTLVGHKIGLTSAPMQILLGVDEPDFGYILDDMVVPAGTAVPQTRFCAPRVEPEVAFLLHTALRGPGVTVEEVYAATKAVAVALEIVDSRIADWKIKLADTVSDLASNGAVAFGSRVVPLGDFDPALIGMVFTRNGDLVATGAGAAALGGPIDAVAWLANTLHPLGVTLPAGAIIMTGALHAAVPFERGDVFRADFDRLGPITLRTV